MIISIQKSDYFYPISGPSANFLEVCGISHRKNFPDVNKKATRTQQLACNYGVRGRVTAEAKHRIPKRAASLICQPAGQPDTPKLRNDQLRPFVQRQLSVFPGGKPNETKGTKFELFRVANTNPNRQLVPFSLFLRKHFSASVQ